MHQLHAIAARPVSAPPFKRMLLAPVVLCVVAVLCGGLLYRHSLATPATVPGIHFAGQVLEAVPHSELATLVERAAQAYLAERITLRLGPRSMRVSRRQLGAIVNHQATMRELAEIGKSGAFFRDVATRVSALHGGVTVDLFPELSRDRALAFFVELKEHVDRPAVNPRLDLDNRKAIPGKDGYRLRVYDCLAAAELALQRNDATIDLPVTMVSPVQSPQENFSKLDISTVLGEFDTVYSLADVDQDRAFNLKMGAGKLDGFVLPPNAVFSYNDTVGARTEKEGYRTALVINEGELVDGMAGGSCQLSSTLFAAAFFAGLQLESSRPHTRPSSYIKLGLDATVVYPSTDLKLRNPFPFPVVFSLRVSQGKVRARILGRERPFHKVAFVRELTETIPFKVVTRDDPNIPAGRTVITQRGVPGFRVIRKRLFYTSNSRTPEREESRPLSYPPTTEYVSRGTGAANPDWQPPKEKPVFGAVPEEFVLEQ